MSGSARAIESMRRGAYLPRVSITRLMRFLTIFAVLLSPISMVGGTAAQAMGHGTAAEHESAETPMPHCADMDDKSKGDVRASIDCTIACAALISELSRVDAPALALTPMHRPVVNVTVRGLRPEAATPPPRNT